MKLSKIIDFFFTFNIKTILVWSLVIIICFLSFSSVNANIVNQTNPLFTVYLPLILKQEPPEPIITPTATLQPTIQPTAIPTATQVPPPTGVYILPNHTSFVDSIDYINIFGEVQNNTSNNLRFVKISVNIFNSAQQLVETDFTYTYLDDLPAGEKTCFAFYVPKPTDWSYYEFEPVSYWTDGSPLPNLTVTQHAGSYDSYFGWYEIIGQVRNDEDVLVEFVQPVGTLYNSSDAVIGCDFTFVNSTDLAPDQISSFELTFWDRDYPDVASYRLQVDGMK